MSEQISRSGAERWREADEGPGSGTMSLLPLLAILAALGCQSAPAPPVTLSQDPSFSVRAEEALARTMPETPVQIIFDFRLREADLRFNGQGVARVEPPYRVRIDLFSNQGEGLFRAALVGSELRVPPGVPIDLAPPPALLWAALGVFRPEPGHRFRGGRPAGSNTLNLRYAGEEGQELRFRISDDLLTRAEVRENGRVIEEVDLTLDSSSKNVVETVYRNHPLFLELNFMLKSIETVDSFPSDIWNPVG